jgi:hypothetical protein
VPYKCYDCGWVGEPEWHKETEWSEVFGAREARTVVVGTCQDCDGDQLDKCSLCVDCLDCGETIEATHDGRCKPHYDENQVCQSDAARDARREDFRRDQCEPVAELTRKKA